MRDDDPRQLAVAVVPVSGQLDLKSMAAACNAKKVEMAEPARPSGSPAMSGGISLLGQKRRSPTVVDTSAGGFETVLSVAAGAASTSRLRRVTWSVCARRRWRRLAGEWCGVSVTGFVPGARSLIRQESASCRQT